MTPKPSLCIIIIVTTALNWAGLSRDPIGEADIYLWAFASMSSNVITGVSGFVAQGAQAQVGGAKAKVLGNVTKKNGWNVVHYIVDFPPPDDVVGMGLNINTIGHHEVGIGWIIVSAFCKN